MHIFWQKRIVAPPRDVETKWWYPAKTDQGAMRADRLVLPIPPGVHWSDEMPVSAEGPRESREPRKRVVSPEVGATGGPQEPTPKPRAAVQFGVPSAKPAVVEAIPEPKVETALAKVARPKERIDPQLIARARELRDRWLEQVNAGAYVFEEAGKYDVSRALSVAVVPPALLPAA